MSPEELAVLYEDNHVIVVIKPHNIPTQKDETNDTDMLTMVKTYLKETHNKPGNVYAGLVHRLDRPTGGVMVFAKTSKAAERLCAQLAGHEFEKKYITVTIGAPRDKRGKLVNYLLKDEQNNIVRIVPLSSQDAKRAELDYIVFDEHDGLSLVNINLITGRSHQARVQMAGVGCPIFGDVKYGGDRAVKNNFLALWAYSLKFTHPTTQKVMVFKVFPETDKIPWKYFSIEKHINIAKPE